MVEAWATPGLVWLCLTFVIAGVVRGFSGFGTALIFMPVGTIFLTVPQAIVAVTLTGVATWGLIVPRALREGDKGEVGLLALGAFLTAPLGVWFLTWLDGALLRWLVAGAAAATLVALISGWRYTRRVPTPGLAAVGAAAGVLGGTTGLTGPPVILFYLAGAGGAAKVRANTILFLAALDVGIIVNLGIRQLVGWSDVALALWLAVPYSLGIVVGQRAFRPDREKTYRAIAYGVIALAIVTGLPVFR
nr:sulfite exporter TauE/SafE family protein [Maritimibacter dapengensis]